jgi:hypothetical protein
MFLYKNIITKTILINLDLYYNICMNNIRGNKTVRLVVIIILLVVATYLYFTI